MTFQNKLVLLSSLALVACGSKDQEPGLDGNAWSSECYSTGSAGSVQVTYSYSGKNESHDTEFFSDTGCQSVTYRSRQVNEFAEGEAREDLGPGARDFTRTFLKETRVAYTQQDADRLNAKKECGISDWAPGIERDTTSCSTENRGPEHNVYMVRNDTLLFGDKTNPETGQWDATYAPQGFEGVGFKRRGIQTP